MLTIRVESVDLQPEARTNLHITGQPLSLRLIDLALLTEIGRHC